MTDQFKGLTPREKQHARFILALGPRLLGRYSDGGPGEPRGSRRQGRDVPGKGGRFARSVRRRRWRS